MFHYPIYFLELTEVKKNLSSENQRNNNNNNFFFFFSMGIWVKFLS